MAHHHTTDSDNTFQPANGTVSWFAAGALAVAAAIGLFLYADGYFQSEMADPPALIIEGG